MGLYQVIALTIDRRITCFLVLRLFLKQLVVMDLLLLSSYFKKCVFSGECALLLLSLEYLKDIFLFLNLHLFFPLGHLFFT